MTRKLSESALAALQLIKDDRHEEVQTRTIVALARKGLVRISHRDVLVSFRPAAHSWSKTRWYKRVPSISSVEITNDGLKALTSGSGVGRRNMSGSDPRMASTLRQAERLARSGDTASAAFLLGIVWSHITPRTDSNLQRAADDLRAALGISRSW